MFLLTRPVSDSRSMVTSGALAIRGEGVYRLPFTSRHPVHTTLSDIGATDRLSDVRGRCRYVRTFPCISIGEDRFCPVLQRAHPSNAPIRPRPVPGTGLIDFIRSTSFGPCRPSRKTDGEPPFFAYKRQGRTPNHRGPHTQNCRTRTGRPGTRRAVSRQIWFRLPQSILHRQSTKNPTRY